MQRWVTIIIGGLIQDKVDKTRSNVPFFGDIPIIGMTFRKDTIAVTKTELVVFLTPKIVSGDTNFLESSKTAIRFYKSKEKNIWKDKGDALIFQR